MKKCVYTILCLLVAISAGADLILSNPTAVPIENITVSQLLTGGNAIQSRHKSASDWKGLGQSFLWNSADALDGIGLYMNSDQPVYGSDLQYALVIQELDGYTGKPTSTVYQVEFTMTKEHVGANKWLYIDIDNLNLKNNQNYGFTLTPTAAAISGGHVMYWATSTAADAYTGGAANLMDIVTRGLPPGSSTAYGSNGRDATFYLQTIPEPSTLGLFIISMCGVFGVRRVVSR